MTTGRYARKISRGRTGGARSQYDRLRLVTDDLPVRIVNRRFYIRHSLYFDRPRRTIIGYPGHRDAKGRRTIERTGRKEKGIRLSVGNGRTNHDGRRSILHVNDLGIIQRLTRPGAPIQQGPGPDDGKSAFTLVDGRAVAVGSAQVAIGLIERKGAVSRLHHGKAGLRRMRVTVFIESEIAVATQPHRRRRQRHVVKIGFANANGLYASRTIAGRVRGRETALNSYWIAVPIFRDLIRKAGRDVVRTVVEKNGVLEM